MSYLIPPRRTDQADVDAFVAGVKRVKEKHEAESAANHRLQLADAEITALTANLEAAEKDVVRITAERDKSWTDGCNLLDTITEQAAQIESLEKDAARWCSIHALMFIGNVELSQCEDGGYSISIDPVENIIGKTWVGDTPEEAIDAAILGDSHVR